MTWSLNPFRDPTTLSSGARTLHPGPERANACNRAKSQAGAFSPCHELQAFPKAQRPCGENTKCKAQRAECKAPCNKNCNANRAAHASTNDAPVQSIDTAAACTPAAQNIVSHNAGFLRRLTKLLAMSKLGFVCVCVCVCVSWCFCFLVARSRCGICASTFVAWDS